MGSAACGGASDESGATHVLAGFYPLAFAAEQIGGDGVDVTNLTPAGAEPHDLELTPREVEEILDADLVLYVGEGFQPAVEEVAAESSGESIDALEGLQLRDGDPRLARPGALRAGGRANRRATWAGRHPRGSWLPG